MALPEAVRVKLEAEMREIWDMSCQAGTHGMLDEAEFHLVEDRLAEFRKGLMAMPGVAAAAVGCSRCVWFAGEGPGRATGGSQATRSAE